MQDGPRRLRPYPDHHQGPVRDARHQQQQSRHRRPASRGRPQTRHCPTDLTTPSWKYILQKTVREFSDDQCTDLAAALTYYAVLALFPALLALVSLLGLIGQRQQGTQAADGHRPSMSAPGRSPTPSGQPLQQLTENPVGRAGAGHRLAGALWSASGYVGAFGRAMNRIYEIDEGRPFWKLRPLMIVITLVAVILAASGRDRPGGHRAGRPGDRRRHRARRHRRHRLEHRQVAGAAGDRGRWSSRSCTTPPRT